MVWLVFYPLTMWQVLTRPAKMMAYADDELDDAETDRYSDKLSPPIFLAITLGLSHLLEIAIGLPGEQKGLLSDDQNLLAFRMISFSVFPLVLAVRLLRKRGETLDRKTLRPPFYAQCFVAASWALVVGVVPTVAAAFKEVRTEWAMIAGACDLRRVDLVHRTPNQLVRPEPRGPLVDRVAARARHFSRGDSRRRATLNCG